MMKCSKLWLAVLVALASFVSVQADVLTVYDDNAYLDYSEYVPIYGYYFDAPDFATQVIYHEEDIQAMQGALITSLKFYIANDEGSTLSGGKLGLSLGITDLEQFSGYQPELLQDLTEVAEFTMTPGETEVVVNFDQPFAYTGGNLVVKTTVKESSGYASMYFVGEATDFNASM